MEELKKIAIENGFVSTNKRVLKKEYEEFLKNNNINLPCKKRKIQNSETKIKKQKICNDEFVDDDEDEKKIVIEKPKNTKSLKSKRKNKILNFVQKVKKELNEDKKIVISNFGNYCIHDNKIVGKFDEENKLVSLTHDDCDKLLGTRINFDCLKIVPNNFGQNQMEESESSSEEN